MTSFHQQRRLHGLNLSESIRTRHLRGLGKGLRSSIESNPCFVRGLVLSKRFRGHEGCVNTINWNASGTLLVSGSDDRDVIVWDSRGTLKKRQHTGHRHNLFNAQFVPETDDTQVICSSGDGTIRLLDITSESEGSIVGECDSMALKLAFLNGSSSVLLSASMDNVVRLIDLRQPSNKTSKLLDLEKEIFGLSVDPFSQSLFAVGAEDEFVRIFDLRYPSLVSHGGHAEAWKANPVREMTTSYLETKLGVGVSCVAYSKRHPGWLLANYKESDLFIFDTANLDYNDSIKRFTGRENIQTFCKEAVFLNSEAHVATGGDDGNLYVWEVQTEELLYRQRGDASIVNCVSPQPFSPNIAVSGIDHDIKFFQPLRSVGMKLSRFVDSDDGRGRSAFGWRFRQDRAGDPMLTESEAYVRIRKAEAEKGLGNTLIKSDPEKAKEAYRSALRLLSFFYPTPEAEESALAAKAICMLNLGAAFLALEDYKSTSAMCTEILSKHRDRLTFAQVSKALFRRAKSQLALKDPEGAERDVLEAMELCPDDPGLVALLEQAVQAKKALHNQEKEKYKNMFPSSSSKA